MNVDVLLYLLSKFPYGVGRMRLMKLLFLIDATADKPITGVRWVRYLYGPFRGRSLKPSTSWRRGAWSTSIGIWRLDTCTSAPHPSFLKTLRRS